MIRRPRIYQTRPARHLQIVNDRRIWSAVALRPQRRRWAAAWWRAAAVLGREIALTLLSRLSRPSLTPAQGPAGSLPWSVSRWLGPIKIPVAKWLSDRDFDSRRNPLLRQACFEQGVHRHHFLIAPGRIGRAVPIDDLGEPLVLDGIANADAGLAVADHYGSEDAGGRFLRRDLQVPCPDRPGSPA